jgi:hypothetical protein
MTDSARTVIVILECVTDLPLDVLEAKTTWPGVGVRQVNVMVQQPPPENPMWRSAE